AGGATASKGEQWGSTRKRLGRQEQGKSSLLWLLGESHRDGGQVGLRRPHGARGASRVLHTDRRGIGATLAGSEVGLTRETQGVSTGTVASNTGPTPWSRAGRREGRDEHSS